ncbi:MAG TPA: PilZ domain-containing protein [Symbiobacteriaceae bacterium]|nr:PilZ domain-containing protein [Symbiobacteriaceae bacterium]
MWHYGDSQRFRQAAQPPSALAQSAFDLLLGMRSVAVTLLFLDLSVPEHPVTEIPGFVEQVSTSCLTLGLAAPLPRVDPRTRFGVEIMAGPGILRFQVAAFRTPEAGATRLQLMLPRQIESVQRRKFSRVRFSAPVAFSVVSDQTTGDAPHGGVGTGLDLSAGGMRLMTQIPLRYGETLTVNFHTPDGTAYNGVTGKVVRVQTAEHRYNVALRFTDVGETVENQLVQSVFRLQLRTVAK